MSAGTMRCEGCGTSMAAYKATCPRCGMPTARPGATPPPPPPALVLPAAPGTVAATLPSPSRRRGALPVSAAVLAPLALLLLVVVFLIGRHSGSSSNDATPSAGGRVAAAAAVNNAATTATPAPAGASVGGHASGLVAHGHLISVGPTDGQCPLEGTVLSATGDDGSIVGAVALHGEESKGACDYAFWLPVTTSATLTFHAGSYPVIGPDGHDGQVLSTALRRDLVLLVQ